MEWHITSIAFPAIGTGTLQFPRSEVAEIYFDEIKSFDQRNPATSLKEVRFVLYDQDQPTVQAFEAELQRRNEKTLPIPVRKGATSIGKRYRKATAKGLQETSFQAATFSPVRERNPDHLETNVGTLCFKVQPGDITKETTDAIVIISNPDLDMMRGGGAGAAILRSGGDSIQKECFAQGLQLPGSVVVTKAGNLRARFIFHIVPSELLNTKALVMKCLEEAEKQGISSISFPAIGTGNLGIPAKSCADTMLFAISDFNDKQPTSMQLIKMIIFQKDMIKDVWLAITKVCGEESTAKPGFFKRVAEVVSKVGSVFGLVDPEKEDRSSESPPNDYNKDVDLVIFAGSKEDLNGAINDINEAMKENSTKQVIKNEAIQLLSQRHVRIIHTLEQRYDVLIVVEKAVGRIVVRGQSGDILNVSGEIHKILHQLREEEHERKRADAMSKDIQWMYRDGTKFVHYVSHVNAKIEIAYDEKKPTVIITSDDGEDYEIDVKKMTKTDDYGNVIKVERVDLRKGKNIF